MKLEPLAVVIDDQLVCLMSQMFVFLGVFFTLNKHKIHIMVFTTSGKKQSVMYIFNLYFILKILFSYFFSFHFHKNIGVFCTLELHSPFLILGTFFLLANIPILSNS